MNKLQYLGVHQIENGGAAIDYYTVQYRVSGVADWTTFGNTPDGTTTSLM